MADANAADKALRNELKRPQKKKQPIPIINKEEEPEPSIKNEAPKQTIPPFIIDVKPKTFEPATVIAQKSKKKVPSTLPNSECNTEIENLRKENLDKERRNTALWSENRGFERLLAAQKAVILREQEIILNLLDFIKSTPGIELPPNLATKYDKYKLRYDAITSIPITSALQRSATRIKSTRGGTKGPYNMEVSFDEMSFTVPHVRGTVNNEDGRTTYAAVIDDETTRHYESLSDSLRKDTIYNQGKMKLILRDQGGSIVAEEYGDYNVNVDGTQRTYVMQSKDSRVYVNDIGAGTLKLKMVALDVAT